MIYRFTERADFFKKMRVYTILTASFVWYEPSHCFEDSIRAKLNTTKATRYTIRLPKKTAHCLFIKKSFYASAFSSSSVVRVSSMFKQSIVEDVLENFL